MSGIVAKGRRVLFIKPNIKDWERGVIVVCKHCGEIQIVKEGSLCDIWKLCSDCARREIEAGQLKHWRRGA